MPRVSLSADDGVDLGLGVVEFPGRDSLAAAREHDPVLLLDHFSEASQKLLLPGGGIDPGTLLSDVASDVSHPLNCRLSIGSMNADDEGRKSFARMRAKM